MSMNPWLWWSMVIANLTVGLMNVAVMFGPGGSAINIIVALSNFLIVVLYVTAFRPEYKGRKK